MSDKCFVLQAWGVINVAIRPGVAVVQQAGRLSPAALWSSMTIERETWRPQLLP
jgi:hypothetical protein